MNRNVNLESTIYACRWRMDGGSNEGEKVERWKARIRREGEGNEGIFVRRISLFYFVGHGGVSVITICKHANALIQNWPKYSNSVRSVVLDLNIICM